MGPVSCTGQEHDVDKDAHAHPLPATTARPRRRRCPHRDRPGLRAGLSVAGAVKTPAQLALHGGATRLNGGYGPQAANVVGLTDQTDLHLTIARALRLDTPQRGS